MEQRSQADIDALIKKNEVEEQTILFRASLVESSNLMEEMARKNEETMLESEIAKLQKEYDDTIAEISKISDSELQREEQAANKELDDLVRVGQSGDTEYQVALAKYEAELKEYEAEVKRIEAEEQRKRDLTTHILKQAPDFMALGLIPTDLTGDALVQATEAVMIEQGDRERLLVGGGEDTWERRRRAALYYKYTQYLRAYQKFSIKYRKDIEEYQNGWDVDGVEIRNVGKFWMPFGLRHVLDASDPARHGGIVRPYWKLKPIQGRARARRPAPLIRYKWDGNDWVQQNEQWLVENPYLAPTLRFNDTDIITFDKNGVWGNQIVPEPADGLYSYRYKYADFLIEFDQEFHEDFANLPSGRSWTLPRNYKVMGLHPTTRSYYDHTERLAFETCKPGYWFKRGIPEETSQCVYMGDSMMDYKESYYPAYATPTVKNGPFDPETYDRYFYNFNTQVVDFTRRTKEESIGDAENYKKSDADKVVITPTGGITTEGVLAQNRAAGGVMD